jgi:hypothetical protein
MLLQLRRYILLLYFGVFGSAIFIAKSLQIQAFIFDRHSYLESKEMKRYLLFLSVAVFVAACSKEKTEQEPAASNVTKPAYEYPIPKAQLDFFELAYSMPYIRKDEVGTRGGEEHVRQINGQLNNGYEMVLGSDGYPDIKRKTGQGLQEIKDWVCKVNFTVEGADDRATCELLADNPETIFFTVKDGEKFYKGDIIAITAKVDELLIGCFGNGWLKQLTLDKNMAVKIVKKGI